MVLMKITVCSSMRNIREIRELKAFLREKGLDVHFPDMDAVVPETGMSEELMIRLQRDHFASIESSDLVYVLTTDKYVGRMVSIEIGFARALGKTLIYSGRTGQVELDVLADGFLDSDGLVEQFIQKQTASGGD